MDQTTYSVASVDAAGSVVCVTEQTVFTYHDDPPTVAAELEASLYASVAALQVFDAYDVTGQAVEAGQRMGRDFHPTGPPVIRRKHGGVSHSPPTG